ncbi:hypothetical protein KH400_05225 [Desertibacillus haloalkaliphilus]|nr:hypothetical protein [Desertibacillus haloalkaliphilus]
MLKQLIHIVGVNNQTLTEFKDEANIRFNRLERNFKLLESDMDLLHRESSDHKREINRLKQMQ